MSIRARHARGVVRVCVGGGPPAHAVEAPVPAVVRVEDDYVSDDIHVLAIMGVSERVSE